MRARSSELRARVYASCADRGSVANVLVILITATDRSMLFRKAAPVTSLLVGTVASFRTTAVQRAVGTATMSSTDESCGFKWHRSMLRCKVSQGAYSMEMEIRNQCQPELEGAGWRPSSRAQEEVCFWFFVLIWKLEVRTEVLCRPVGRRSRRCACGQRISSCRMPCGGSVERCDCCWVLSPKPVHSLQPIA